MASEQERSPPPQDLDGYYLVHCPFNMDRAFVCPYAEACWWYVLGYIVVTRQGDAWSVS